MDLYCSTGCGQLLVRASQIIYDSAGIPDGLVPIRPVDTVVLGTESTTMLFGPMMMQSDLFCARCGYLVGFLFYHRQVLGTAENDDPDYLFRIGFERVLYRLCTKGSGKKIPEDVIVLLFEGLDSSDQIQDDVLYHLIGGIDISQDQNEDDILEPLMGGLNEVERLRHNEAKERAARHQNDDL